MYLFLEEEEMKVSREVVQEKTLPELAFRLARVLPAVLRQAVLEHGLTDEIVLENYEGIRDVLEEGTEENFVLRLAYGMAVRMHLKIEATVAENKVHADVSFFAPGDEFLLELRCSFGQSGRCFYHGRGVAKKLLQ